MVENSRFLEKNRKANSEYAEDIERCAYFLISD